MKAVETRLAAMRPAIVPAVADTAGNERKASAPGAALGPALDQVRAPPAGGAVALNAVMELDITGFLREHCENHPLQSHIRRIP
jgi:hypothetical protein